jgi:hypothetical protein
VQKCYQNAQKETKNEEARKHTQEKRRDEMHTKGLEVQECKNIHKKKGCVIMKIKISDNNNSLNIEN